MLEQFHTGSSQCCNSGNEDKSLENNRIWRKKGCTSCSSCGDKEAEPQPLQGSWEATNLTEAFSGSRQYHSHQIGVKHLRLPSPSTWLPEREQQQLLVQHQPSLPWALPGIQTPLKSISNHFATGNSIYFHVSNLAKQVPAKCSWLFIPLQEETATMSRATTGAFQHIKQPDI